MFGNVSDQIRSVAQSCPPTLCDPMITYPKIEGLHKKIEYVKFTGATLKFKCMYLIFFYGKFP